MNIKSASKRRVTAGILALAIMVLPLGGCRLTIDSPFVISGDLFSNISGWDLSACTGGGLQTCAGLFAANEQLILGGSTVEQLLTDATIGLLRTVDGAEVRLGGAPG